MATTIPASHVDLLQMAKPAFAQLATINADGSPQVTPVWVDYDGTHVLVNTARGRVKAKNLERNPRVALAISDPQNPYRYVGIQGHVVEMTEQGGDAHIDKMAKKYLHQDRYPRRRPGEVRVIVKIAPEKVHTNR
ncbi:MAG TPA: PPOX class F420-dependent oxidoreductase [Vicinamibacterales bacterium]|nr:PPOX class F420-dependent oxidoreductase [Vicinamibacterales bacterium]